MIVANETTIMQRRDICEHVHVHVHVKMPSRQDAQPQLCICEHVDVSVRDGRDPRTFTGRTVLNSGVILGQLSTLLAYLDWLLASAGPWCDQGRLNAFALAFPERVAAPPLGASRFLT